MVATCTGQATTISLRKSKGPLTGTAKCKPLSLVYAAGARWDSVPELLLCQGIKWGTKLQKMSEEWKIQEKGKMAEI